MDIKQKVTSCSLEHYKRITAVMVVFTLALGALIPMIKVDTDPENMLAEDEPVRKFHTETKKRFNLSDIVVVGIVNNKDPNGVFNPSSLAKIHKLTEFAETLRWADEEYPYEQIGVIKQDLLAPSHVDHIGQGGPHEVKFEWLMREPPATQAKALEIRDKAMSNPMLKGTMVSDDGKAMCLYLPLTKKDLSHRIYTEIQKRIPVIDTWMGLGQVVITQSAENEEISQESAESLLSGYSMLMQLLAFQSESPAQFKADYERVSELMRRPDFTMGSAAVKRAFTAQAWSDKVKSLDKRFKPLFDPLTEQQKSLAAKLTEEADRLIQNLRSQPPDPQDSTQWNEQVEALEEKISAIARAVSDGLIAKSLEDKFIDDLEQFGSIVEELQFEGVSFEHFTATTLEALQVNRQIWQVSFEASNISHTALNKRLAEALKDPAIVLKETAQLDSTWLHLAQLFANSLKGEAYTAQNKAMRIQALVETLGAELEHSRFLDSPSLRSQSDTIPPDEEYHITGLPVAEDTFGVEMFIQMAISAPLAMVVIFLLMLLFFRKLVLVISPMIVAMVSVISTMGLLIGFGFPVHIMSSMIPIFLMPIAVVDSVHILSEFFDLYTKEKGRKETTVEVMGHLFMPMLYTSLTSAAGFASLALTPIPPVQVFGVFVAIGIMIAWVCTITFVPAYIMMIKESSLENFGSGHSQAEAKSWLSRLLTGGGNFTYTKAKPILVVILIAAVVAIYGITRIEINDNPVRWFSESHPIRIADDELNDHFGGTYMAYLVLDPNDDGSVQHSYVGELRTRLSDKLLELKDDFPNVGEILTEAETKLLDQASQIKTKDDLLDKLSTFASDKIDTVDEKDVDVWYEIADFFELEKERLKLFKQPEVLRYISGLQKHLGPEDLEIVGKSNSVADIVKKVHQELIDGKDENYRIPDSSGAVAECLFQFQNSHKPEDLWHLVTTDYMRANIWIQLPSGDNKDMEKVVKAVDKYFADNPHPVPLQHSWAGLTYINTVWQDKMVWGMLQSFMGSFIIVFIMMAILFRSLLWGLVCMVPLLVTIIVIYGIIGLVGKDYDMPVAVLSALTLGMAVDFAIHFLERARASYAETGSWQRSAGVMFGEPARAIARNVLVIAIGFLPLLAAPLIPYKTVGIFLCAIMALSGAVTLLALPAIITLAGKVLFKRVDETRPSTCKCAFCFVISMAVVILVAVNLHQYWELGWGAMGLISIAAIAASTIACGLISRRQACRNVALREGKLQENKSSGDES